MEKKESSLLKLILSLTLISLFAAAALAAVYSVTKEPIEKAIVAKKNDAIQLVLPGFDFEKGEVKMQKVLIEGDTDEADSVTLYIAEIDNLFYGAAIESFTNIAFNGRFDIMVGIDKDGTVLGTEVLKHNETPGLGDNINKTKSNFSKQFKGINLTKKRLLLKKVGERGGGDNDDIVVAITAATISSTAYCDAVERANKAFLMIKGSYDSVSAVDSTNSVTTK